MSRFLLGKCMWSSQEAFRTCQECYLLTAAYPLQLPVVEEEEKSKNQDFVEHLRQMKDAKDVLATFMKENELFDLSWMQQEEQELFYEFSMKFVEDAKQFDELLPEEEIYQALRNVWIIWMLELLFDKPLRYHEAMFGYSMLYPYSDNLLDDQSKSMEDKVKFNEWFTKRLHGESVEAASYREEKIVQLIALIEQRFPRSEYADVYESLYLIQDAQIASLSQRKQKDYPSIFEVSVYKGGASVIADGYLIDGSLTKQQFQFCVDFGFGLQIVDDLQDMIEDDKAQHHTLATLCKTKQERLALFEKCWAFLEVVVQGSTCSRQKAKDFVEESCKQLLAACVLQQKEQYPTVLFQELKQALPLEETYMAMVSEELKEKMESQSYQQ